MSSTDRTGDPDTGDPAGTPSAPAAPAVTRALSVLALLEEHAPEAVSLVAIARGIDVAKSSTLHICTALERGGMIVRRPGGYRLGRRTVELGGSYLAGFNQIREFYSFCADAPLLRGEVVQVAILEGTDVVYLARHEGHAPMRFIAGIGSRLPAAPTAVGNALLTTLTDTEIVGRFAEPRHFPRLTDHSVATLPALLAKIGLARERGYALDDGEVHPGIVGVATVLPPWTAGEPHLAIGTSLAASTATPGHVERIVRELRAATEYLTNPLTGPAAGPATAVPGPLPARPGRALPGS